jgi:hypothetical protein
MNDINQAPDPNHNPQEPIAFCQNCSTILTHETIRKVGANVFCEPCLAARLASPPPPPGGATGAPDPSSYGPGFGAGFGTGYGPVNTGANPYSGGPFTPPPPGAPGAPNPGLAALLGLIPGVGAMYNEQYAKGLAHLLIFAVLVMFSHIAGIFGLFVVGWIAYMSIEAHHTAKARRDGTPLPNPFGLNDIGERMGFAQTFPRGQDVAAAAREAARDAAAYAAANFNRPTAYTQGPIVTPPPVPPAPPTWGAPADTYATPPTYAPPYTQQPYTSHPPYTEPFMPPTAAVPPFTAPPVPTQPHFPTGAVVLIGLGMLFLFGTMGVFHVVPGSALIGIFLLGLGVKTFYDRMTRTGKGIAYDGTPDYNVRVVSALNGSIWLIVIGGLWLLDIFHILHWSDSWPWLIILVGVMMLAKRAAYNSAAAACAPPVYPSSYPPPASEPIITPPPTSNEQPTTHNEQRSGNEGAL